MIDESVCVCLQFSAVESVQSMIIDAATRARNQRGPITPTIETTRSKDCKERTLWALDGGIRQCNGLHCGPWQGVQTLPRAGTTEQ